MNIDALGRYLVIPSELQEQSLGIISSSGNVILKTFYFAAVVGYFWTKISFSTHLV